MRWSEGMSAWLAWLRTRCGPLALRDSGRCENATVGWLPLGWLELWPELGPTLNYFNDSSLSVISFLT